MRRINISFLAVILSVWFAGIAQAETLPKYYCNNTGGCGVQTYSVDGKPPVELEIYLICGTPENSYKPTTIICKSPNTTIDCKKQRESDDVFYQKCVCNWALYKQKYKAKYGISECPNIP